MEDLTGLGEAPLWLQIWHQKAHQIVIFSAFLILIILIMLFCDRLSKSRGAMKAVRYLVLGFSFIYVGLVLKAQPTTTNIIIMVNSLKQVEFPLNTLYILEPYIFLTFIFIFITLLIWGRGVFCGWLCPYGAMLELLNKLYGRFLRFRLVVPEKIHRRLIYLKYVVFAIILAVSFYNFMLSEYLTEVEPFRTFVLKLNREWYFILYFFLITFGSVVIYRAFCRYLCPLGAVLALPLLFRRSGLVNVKLRDLCGRCTTCGRGCAYQAIKSSGYIDSSECFYCMDCQLNFWDEDICPVLIKQRKQAERQRAGKRGMNMHAVSFFFLMLLTPLLLSPPYTLAKTLRVGPDYPTIKDALKVARDGDIIEVIGGEYREGIKIQKRIHLKGIDNPVITLSRGNIMEITSSGVTVEGFTLTYDTTDLSSTDTAIYIRKGAERVTIRGNRLLRVMFGVWNVEGREIVIENNTITGLKDFETTYRGNCINLTGTQKVRITNNRLSYCRDGIYMELCHDATVIGNEIEESRYSIHTMWVDRGVFNNNTAHDNLVGLAIMYTDYPEVRDNLSYGNKTHGILFIQSVKGKITGNTVIGNTKGIFLYNSVYNEIRSNLVMNNQLGIHSWGGSEDNEISDNSFISNEVQVKYVSSKNQEWNDNYWSDYIGWDITGDGIGDSPYESSTIVDYIFWKYPLAKVLFASPSLHILWLLEKQFPLLQIPKVIDNRPSMVPKHKNWLELKKKYSAYIPERYYGEIKKLPHLPGGGI